MTILGDTMTAMRRALLSATFLATASALSAANAADVYSPPASIKDEPVAYLPAITWTGFYLGAHVGSTFEGTDTIGGVEFELDDTGLAGFQIGYNWQSSRNFVFGIEGDASFPFDDIGVDYIASIRGRIGYAAGSALLYATGGAAFLGFSESEDDALTGYAVGVGLDYKLRQNISFGVESLYYNFEDDVDIAGAVFDEEIEFWTVRARLNYHFGGRDAPLK
jgi:outer membrane immunogenic protein